MFITMTYKYYCLAKYNKSSQQRFMNVSIQSDGKTLFLKQSEYLPLFKSRQFEHYNNTLFIAIKEINIRTTLHDSEF